MNAAVKPAAAGSVRVAMNRIHATAAAALLLVCAAAAPAAAQNREHQQMAAELRMLQEQQQQIATTLTQLGEALKAINARIDETNNATRKGFADEKLVVDAMATDLRTIRERVDDSNVRLGTLREEVDAIRTTLPSLAQPQTAAPVDPADPNAGAVASVPPPAAPSTVGLSPTRMYEQAFGDYAAGQYSLAITGFESFLRTFPQSAMADDAQFYIGETYAAQSRFAEAITAYNAVIQNYPMGDQVPTAYFKRGAAQERLGQSDQARASWEAAVRLFPDTDGARLAAQRLAGKPPSAPATTPAGR
jgi:tol-pal system protein YbgF